MNRRFHGCCRVWHRNGRLAEELRFHHGLLHGLSRQWDETGQLLGSFRMVRGTGIQRYWHDNGQLRLEIHSVNGKFFGPTRMWLRDGTLVQETYYISDVDVGRTGYLKVARKHSEWPQCVEVSAGRVAPDTISLRRKTHKLFIESLLSKSYAEASQWLQGAKSPHLRSLARFRTAQAALWFVEKLYATGANTIIAVPVYAGKRGKLFADSLLVKLPKMMSKRKALRKCCQKFCDRHGGALLPEKDIAESHLFLGLA